MLDRPNIPPLHTEPTRTFLPPGVKAPADACGFCVSRGDSLTIRSLFDFCGVLIVAPPWMGKSFVAQQSIAFLRQDPQVNEPTSPFGAYIHFTSFEQPGTEDCPAWWKEWETSEGRACWIVDALDEDSGGSLIGRLLATIDGLEALQRQRLCLLLFSRENEVPAAVSKWMARVNGPDGPAFKEIIKTVQLAPLDATAAMAFLGSKELFDCVCELIQRNKLESVAGYPAALKSLARHGAGEELSDTSIWREVLTELLHENVAENLRTNAPPPMDDRFNGAAWIAAALTFGDHDEIDDGKNATVHPSIDQLIPRDHAGLEKLNIAARRALLSGMFRRTANGYQFRQKHVREWMAAFGVAKLSLTRLKPLVTGSDGLILRQYRGLLGLLVRTTKHPQVQGWVKQQFGGIVPRSDAAPWSLAEAIAALDQLQGLTRTAPGGLGFWEDRGLGSINAPGLGQVLASRLSDKALTLLERELILDIALAVQARETAGPAIVVMQDHTEDRRLRASAANVAFTLGTEAQRLEMAEFAKSMPATASSDRQLKGSLVYYLYSARLWTYATALEHLPDGDEREEGSFPGILLFRLKQDMTLPDARAIARATHIDDLLLRIDAEAGNLRHTPRLGRIELVLRAVELLMGEIEAEEADLDILLPFALAWPRSEWHQFRPRDLLKRYAKNVSARRKLVFASLDMPQATGQWGAREIFGRLPTLEDAEWLRELARSRGDLSFLRDWLLRSTTDPDMPEDLRQSIRAEIEATDPQCVANFDDGLAKDKQRERELAEEEDRARKLYKRHENLEMQPLIESTLDSMMALHEKMLRLTQICLTRDQFRPTNVVGQWDDLSPPLQARTLDVCEMALVKCDPTPVPLGNSFPATIVYEAICFEAILAKRPGSYVLDTVQIQKWLPATIVFIREGMESVIRRCRDVDATTTEGVVMIEIKRRLRSGGSVPYVSGDLFSECWSDQIAGEVAELCLSPDTGVDARIALVRELVQRDRLRATKILRGWLSL